MTNVLQGEVISDRLDDARLFEGVRTRRVIAFLIDYVLIAILVIPVAVLIAFFGVLTLGLGWLLYGIIGPMVALAYVAMTMGGRAQATKGMQWMGIRVERLDGRPLDPLLAMVHTVLFWAGNAVLTPLLLLATLFIDGKRTVHDLLLGTIVVRTGN